MLYTFIKVTFPWFEYKWVHKQRRVGHEDTNRSSTIFRRRIDEDADKPKYECDGVAGPLYDYLELMIQYGFITLFAVAFPLAALIAFITNIWLIRIDRLVLLKLLKRPIPEKANGIGLWKEAMENITMAAIFTNSGIMCFTLRVFDHWEISKGTGLIPFMLMVALAFVVRKIVKGIIIDKPGRYKKVWKRHKYLVDKFIKGYSPYKKGFEKSHEDFDLKIH